MSRIAAPWPAIAAAPAGIGLGSAPLGNLFRAVDDDTAQATIAAAWSAGVRYFDTAPHYGQGLAEQRLGRGLRALPRDRFVLSTKVGRLLVPDPAAPREHAGYVDVPPFRTVVDYGADAALRSIDDSLRRLDLDRIDIVYIHDVDARTHGAEQPRRFAEAMDGAYRALERLRGEGVIGAIGLGVNDWEPCHAALAHGDFDCFMLAGRLSLLDQSAAATLLPACAARGVRLVAAGVFNSGILATGAVPGATFDYREAGAPWLERMQRLQAVCDAYRVPLRAAALQFPRRASAVATVVVGARTPAEIADDIALGMHPIAPAFWQALADAELIPREPLP
ncbi:MAG: aldo/keto reductase [Lautropia sp.]